MMCMCMILLLFLASFFYEAEFKNYITQHFQKAFHLNTWSWLGNVDDSAMNCIEEDVRNFYRNEVEVSFPNRVSCSVRI